MPPLVRSYFHRNPFAAGAASAVAVIVASATLVAAANHVRPFTFGTINYEATTTGPVIDGVQDGSGIGVQGVTNTGAPAGAIALQGFGTSTANASVGVNGAVDGPGSTALIGNANGTSGSPSIGLEGFSAHGEGVFAESTSSAFPSLRSVDSHAFLDVRLSDIATGNGVVSLMNYDSTGNAAVFGDDTVASPSTNNVGVEGLTTNGAFGVFGWARNTAFDGVLGLGDGAIPGVSGNSTAGIGVNGISTSGTAIFGQSSSGFGVSGSSIDSDGVDGVTINPSGTKPARAGVYGLDNSSDGGTLNSGVTGQSSAGTGVTGTSTSNSGVAGVGAVGTVGQCQVTTGVDEFVGEDSSGTINHTTNCSGLMSIMVVTRDKRYAYATVPQTTEPVLEDFGEGRLVNGTASVRLDPAFAASITDRAPYMVFLTPNSDSRGLYVTQKTLQGFVVRENGGGTATLSFDYRIVSQPADASVPRMTLSATPMRASRTASRVSSGAMMAEHVAAWRAQQAAQAATTRRQQQALARIMRNLPRRMPLYEPSIGPSGKLRAGAPYPKQTSGTHSQ